MEYFAATTPWNAIATIVITSLAEPDRDSVPARILDLFFSECARPIYEQRATGRYRIFSRPETFRQFLADHDLVARAILVAF